MKNGKTIGVRRPRGKGIQAVRTDFKIKNTEFINKSNKIVQGSEEIWGIGIDWGVNGLKDDGQIWKNAVRVILFCDTETKKRQKFQDFVKTIIKEKGEKEIVVIGKRPTFAKIEIKDEEIMGQHKEKIAEIIIEKVYKLYNEVEKCFDKYSNVQLMKGRS